MRRHVWVGGETDQPWMRGGSYVVTRRIRMHIEGWDRTSSPIRRSVRPVKVLRGAARRHDEHDPATCRQGAATASR